MRLEVRVAQEMGKELGKRQVLFRKVQEVA
jgi:hypothetical protein